MPISPSSFEYSDLEREIKVRRNPTALFVWGPLKTVGSCERLEMLLFTFPLRFFSLAGTKRLLGLWRKVLVGRRVMGVGIHLAQAGGMLLCSILPSLAGLCVC